MKFNRWIRLAAFAPLAVTAAPQNHPLGQPAAVAMQKEDAAARFDRLVARHGLQQKRTALEAAFPRTPEGAALVRVATIFRKGSVHGFSEESAALVHELAGLRASPAAAFRGIREGLNKLPPGFHPERQFLIQFAIRLEVPEADRVGFLKDELRRVPAAGESREAIFSAAVAAEMLARSVPDRATVRTMLGEAIASNPDRNYRQLMVAMLGKSDPEGAELLRKQYRIE